PTLVSLSKRVSFTDPLSVFSLQSDNSRLYWEDSEGRAAICGLGAACRLEAEGFDRFAKIEEQRKSLIKNAIIEAEPSIPATGPLFLGGFSFDPIREKTRLWRLFPDAELTMPEFMVTNVSGETWLTINALVDGSTDPLQKARELTNERDRLLKQSAQLYMPFVECVKYTINEVESDKWKEIVGDAAAEIRNGAIDKVVLSREIRLTADEPFSAAQALCSLREQQRNSNLFAFQKEGTCFVGASPERLVRSHGSDFVTACLAGTAPRGETVAEDEKFGDDLLADKKNLHEHGLVVDMIHEAMQKVCSHVEMPAQPTLYKVKNVQHLYTPVVGKAMPNTSVIPFVGELHPTPALGGFPQKQSVEKIRQLESYERGWYGAPVGWVDYKGDGEFA
ncbi:MAG TPA: isochorismate synthase, partial [Bacillales bacterium]|nr:isochorismate synthase [Bacillales bacterium]